MELYPHPPKSDRNPDRNAGRTYPVPITGLSRSLSRTALLFLLLAILLHGARAASLAPDCWKLLPQAQAHADGIYLNEIVESATPLPHVRLAPAPVLGLATLLSRAQVSDLLRQAEPGAMVTNWSGANQVRVTRRTRILAEAEAREMLTAALQRDFVKDRGELELRFSRPWPATVVADESFVVNVLDLPSAGVTPNFILRFELRAGSALLGNWQVPVQARIWRDVWVAGSPLHRGQLLKNADIVQERRDLLALRDALVSLDREDGSLELAENLSTGSALSSRSLRARPVVQRGRVVDAIVQDGALTISVKAEVLEDGVPGQTVRARNLKSKREFRGKVQNEESILVSL